MFLRLRHALYPTYPSGGKGDYLLFKNQFLYQATLQTKPSYTKILPVFLYAFRTISNFIHRKKVDVLDSGFLKRLWGFYLKMPNSW